MDKHFQGSQGVWGEVFTNRDLSYSEDAQTQGKLFEIVKVRFLQSIFPKYGKMLEVGCGTAFVSLYFTKRGFTAHCLDSNQEILNTAEENFKNEKTRGKFVLGDAERLPFENNEFDVVTSYGLLEHFANPKKAISEMVRVTKKGGLVFADIVPSRFSVQTFGNVFNFIVTLGYWIFRGNWEKGLEKAKRNFQPLYFENSLSWADYKKIFQLAGLKSMQIRGNRPFPRLTLPVFADKLYARLLKKAQPAWYNFDQSNSEFARFWGAGYWLWGRKMV